MTTQKVAWPTMIVNRPNSMPNVWKVVLSAMPVTTPGRAMGRTSRKLIESRPKNAKRWTAIAARVPSTRAIATAPSAARIEFMIACGMAGLASASPNHCRPKPGGGHAMKLLSLKALIATIRSGTYRKARTTQVASRRPMRTQADSTTTAAHHSDSNAPSRRATSR